MFKTLFYFYREEDGSDLEDEKNGWLINSALRNTKIPESVRLDIDLFEDGDNKRLINKNDLSSPVSQMGSLLYDRVDADEYNAVQEKSNKLLRENQLLRRRDRNFAQERDHQEQPSGYLAKSSSLSENMFGRKNRVLHDSAIFTGSNMDDTSKNVMSDFSNNSDMISSSNRSSENSSPVLLNAAVKAVNVKPKAIIGNNVSDFFIIIIL